MTIDRITEWNCQWYCIGNDFKYGVQSKQKISKGGRWVDHCLQYFVGEGSQRVYENYAGFRQQDLPQNWVFA